MRAMRALRLFTPMHLVHLTPRTPRARARPQSRMDNTVRPRAACMSLGRASKLSYTLHWISPVLCTMQFIQRPSQMIWAVTMLLPMKAVTRHRGMAQTINPPTQPTMERIRPSNCMPVVAMAKGVIWVRWTCLWYISLCTGQTYSPTKKCDSLCC